MQRRRLQIIPEIGQRYSFIPAVFDGARVISFAGRKYETRVEGRIIHVNRMHRHFTVRGVHPRTGAVVTETFKY